MADSLDLHYPSHAGIGFIETAHHDTYPAIDPARADFAGKVVLVTGASKGIGRTAAISFAQAGASGLVLLARSNMSETKSACEAAATRPGQSIKVLTFSADTSNAAQVSAALAQAKEAFGRLDVVINNAGVVENYSLVGDSDSENWWHTWDVNMRGTYEVTRASLPLLAATEGHKSIILVTSLAAHGVMKTHASAYTMSKLSLLRFAELLVNEYGDKGISAYALHPGTILTDMTADVPDQFKKYLVDKPEVAAHTMVWLARERRDWLTGRYVSSQWDVEELEAKKQEIVDGDKLKVRMSI